MNSNAQPPIIFIGMHRSGTSLLGRLLEQLGLFVGDKKDENNEALFFLEFNTWLMAQCGARWDNPEQLRCLWQPEAEAVLQASRDYAKDLMSSVRAARYLGSKRYLGLRSIMAQQAPWGWKDPRNTFTLPFWLSLFPDAKVVFIERHGVDVAESLRVRAESSIETTKQRYEKLKSLAWLVPKRGGFSDSPRSLSLEGGFSLWESYQSEARQQLSRLPEDKIFRVRYEELLSDPQEILARALKFCGLAGHDGLIREMTASLKPDRAYSYRGFEKLQGFSEEKKETLNFFGYEE